MGGEPGQGLGAGGSLTKYHELLAGVRRAATVLALSRGRWESH